jgi:pseudouridine synthase
VTLEDGVTLPARVEAMDRLAAGGTWLELELTEGRNRQVRRMGEAVGHRVLKLHRSRYAGISVHKLATGRRRPLTRAEWRKLGAMVGLDR